MLLCDGAPCPQVCADVCTCVSVCESACVRAWVWGERGRGLHLMLLQF